MKIQLISGKFQSDDAINILTQMIQVKIKHHESKISSENNEEDTKFSESKIKQLQNNLHEIRTHINKKAGQPISLDATINID